MDNLILWGTIILMAILSIILLSGRGGILVAGYNTASKKEKAKYNEKRLCRTVGGGLGIITIIMASAAFYDFELPPSIGWLIPWGIFATAAVTIVLGNTLCKNKS